MDITQQPGFADTHAGIRRSFGDEWAGRFVLAAPLMFGDPTSPLYRAFLEGLEAHVRGASDVEEEAWDSCQALMQDVADSLVAEAEALLVGPV
ncbi:hypothetical protein ICW40_12090 [Actinotalea ferrariae]|uniref:hypothetical protein n=1 Tax=Actinotalea ferrariae TaxID=1386098 RepID=UPI001C8B7411|nr:hypothetical protein [Actinotalea ferrariae]MBX9245542.1 hypothetical protein [Actinotalea ferrariae]